MYRYIDIYIYRWLIYNYVDGLFTYIAIIIHVTYVHAKQKCLGCKKSARPIRSSPTYVQPKALISAEAKKSPSRIQDVSNYLNEIQ